MPLICTCLQGHRWEHPEAAPGIAAILCPTCGAEAAAMFESEAPPKPSPKPPPVPAAFDPTALSLDFPEAIVVEPDPVPSKPPPSLAPPALPTRSPRLPQRPAERPPSPRPPARSVAGPVVLAIVLTSVGMLLVVGLVLLLLYPQSAAQERERAERARQQAENFGEAFAAQADARAVQERQRAERAILEAEQQARQMRLQIQQAEDRERQAEMQARAAQDAEKVARALAQAQLLTAQDELRREQMRRQQVEAELRQGKGNDQAIKDIEARHQAAIKAVRAESAARDYAQSIALAGWELHANHIPIAAKYVRACPENLRGWEWHYLDRVCGGESPPILQQGKVRSVAFAAGGKQIATVGVPAAVKFWDRTTGAEVFSPPVPARRPNVVVFSADGSRYATCHTTGGPANVKLWDASGKELLTLKDAKPQSKCVGLSPDGKRLALAAPGHQIAIWDDTGKQSLTLTGHKNTVAGVVFSPDGKWIASVSGAVAGIQQPSEVRIWEGASGRQTLVLSVANSSVRSLAFSPDGKTLAAVGTADRIVRLYDPAATDEKTALVKQFADLSSLGWSLVFSADGKRLYVGCSDGAINVWDVAAGQLLRPLEGHTRPVTSLAVSPEGNLLASVDLDGILRFWDISPRRLAVGLKAHTAPVQGLAFSPDGKRIVTASGDKGLTLWDTQTGKSVLAFKGHTRPIARAVFDPQGRRLATISTFADQPGKDVEVKVWDVQEGKELFTLAGQPSEGVGIVFSPSGEAIAITAPGQPLKVFAAATGAAAARFSWQSGELASGERVDCLALSADGKSAAIAQQGGVSVRMFRMNNGQAELDVRPLKAPAGVVSGLAWSPDGTRLALTASGTVSVGEPRAAKPMATFRGNRLSPQVLGLSHDGRRLAIANGKEVGLWDVQAGQILLPLRGHTTAVTCVAFSPDGARVAGGAVNGTVLIWDGSPRTAAAAPPK